jgi:uncharacterized protein YukE
MRGLVIYNAQSIAQWRSDLDTLPNQVETITHEINQERKELQPLEQQLNIVNTQIAVIRSQITSQSINQGIGFLEILDGNNRGGGLGFLEEFVGAATIASSTATKSKLNAQLAQLQSARDQLQRMCNPIINRINGRAAKKESFNNRLATANTHLQPAQKFDANYTNNPEGMYPALAQSITDGLSQYEQTCPSGQTESVQISIIFIHQVLAQEGSDFNKLRAALWKSYRSCNDRTFRNVIEELINRTHLRNNYDSFRNHLDALWFNAAGIRGNLPRHFEAFCIQLEQNYSKVKPLISLINTIKKEARKPADADYKFYISVLKHA